jgi:hypothetical protein
VDVRAGVARFRGLAAGNAVVGMVSGCRCTTPGGRDDGERFGDVGRRGVGVDRAVHGHGPVQPGGTWLGRHAPMVATPV